MRPIDLFGRMRPAQREPRVLPPTATLETGIRAPPSMSRLAATAIAGLVVAACARERPGLQPQHVFLVTIEHLRADRCSFLMHERPTTLLASDELMRAEHRAFSLDDFASEGVVFANAYAPSPLGEVALASLFTARSPLESGVVESDDELPGELVTLAEAFRAGGYDTAAFVGGPREFDPSFASGFDSVETFETDYGALIAAAEHLGSDPGSGARHFTWVHLRSLAPPWDLEQPMPSIVADREFVAADYAGPFDGGEDVIRALNDGKLVASAADREAARAGYDRKLTRLVAQIWIGLNRAFDYHVGGAEASETLARTAFVVAGINGIELLEHGAIGADGLLSDGALHVPILLRHPDSLTGQRIYADVVGLEDVAPTLLEWMHLPPLPGARGRSLLAVTDSYVERPFPARPAIAQLPERAVFSARDERWRLVCNPTRTQPTGRPAAVGALAEVELYDHDEDPAGWHDVAAEHPEVVARLTSAIRSWREALEVRRREARPSPRGD